MANKKNYLWCALAFLLIIGCKGEEEKSCWGRVNSLGYVKQIRVNKGDSEVVYRGLDSGYWWIDTCDIKVIMEDDTLAIIFKTEYERKMLYVGQWSLYDTAAWRDSWRSIVTEHNGRDFKVINDAPNVGGVDTSVNDFVFPKPTKKEKKYREIKTINDGGTIYSDTSVSFGTGDVLYRATIRQITETEYNAGIWRQIKAIYAEDSITLTSEDSVNFFTSKVPFKLSKYKQLTLEDSMKYYISERRRVGQKLNYYLNLMGENSSHSVDNNVRLYLDSENYFISNIWRLHFDKGVAVPKDFFIKQ